MRCARFRLRAALSALALGALGCADVLDIPDDPRLIDAAGHAAPAQAGPWRCLEQPDAAATTVRATAMVRVHACDFVSTNCQAPVTGLTASLCNKRDVNCVNPARSNLRDSNGDFDFEVPTGGSLGTGFDGFLRISAPAAMCTNEAVFGPAGPTLCGFAPGCDPKAPDAKCMVPTFAPSLLFFNPPIKSDLLAPIALPLIPTAAVLTLTTAAGGDVDPTTGNVFVTALDCDGRPAAGVRFAMPRYGEAKVLYVDSGVISDSVFETDASGIGGFLGVPAGFAAVEGSVLIGTREVRIGEIGIQVSPFTITYGTVTPLR